MSARPTDLSQGTVVVDLEGRMAGEPDQREVTVVPADDPAPSDPSALRLVPFDPTSLARLVDRDMVVVELTLAPGIGARVAALRAEGWSVGVLVPSPASGPSPSSAPLPPGPSERGSTLGLLTVAVLAGAQVVRTHDVRAAQRVVAVVAALTAPSSGDGRLAP